MTRGRWIVVLVVAASLLAAGAGVVAWTARSWSRTSADAAADLARADGERLRHMLDAQVPQVNDAQQITDAVHLATGSSGDVRSATFVLRQVDAVVAFTRTASVSTVETAPAATVTLCFHYVRPAGAFDFTATELDRCPHRM